MTHAIQKSRRPLLVALCLGLLIVALGALSASAAGVNFYVNAATGNDANDGLSAATAKQTIGAAVAVAGTDDIINVAAGTYAETVTVNKPLTITGAGTALTIIDPPSGNGMAIRASSITIKDLQITGAAQGANLNGAISNITFDNVHFLNNTSRGIEMQNTDTTLLIENVQVLNSLFNNNGIGIRMSSNTRVEGITIDNTTFQNNVNGGFYEANDSNPNAQPPVLNYGYVKGLTITDSTFTNNGTSSGHAGVYAEEFSDVLIENSTFTGNRYGINLADMYSVANSITANVVIRDNTFTDNKASSINLRSTTGDPAIKLLTVENNVINMNVGVSATGTVYGRIAVMTSGTDIQGAIDIIDNTVTMSGALPAGAVSTHAILIQGSAEGVNIEGNTLDGGNITGYTSAIAPSGVRIVTSIFQTNAGIDVTKNTIHNFVNGVAIHDGNNAWGGIESTSTINITRNDLSSNTAYGIRSGAAGDATVAGGTCNWWGHNSGPGGAGPGSGTQVSTHVDYIPWLYSNDLDGDCNLITVRKSAPDDSSTEFEFDPSWSTDNFTLTDGSSLTISPLPAGNYSVSEINLPAHWLLESATCDNLSTKQTVEEADPANITLVDGDEWECTFTNDYDPTGSITVIKETNPDGKKGFTFTLEPDTHPYVSKWGSYGATDGKFGRAMGIAVDKDGNVYVADDLNHRIQKFDANGNFLIEWGGSPDGSSDPGKLRWPIDVAVDSLGNVYVSDYGNSRIQKFDSNGNFLLTWGSEGSADGQLYYPNSLAVDSAGNVYIADTYNYRIQKFDSSGNHLLTFGNYGILGGEFYVPYGIEVDSSGNIYVSDTYNHRMQKFDASGAFLLAWGWDVVAGNGDTEFEICTAAADCQGGANGGGQGQFSYNGQVAVDEFGNVFVTDTINRIQKFDSDGNLKLSWGGNGTGNGSLAYPFGVAVDGSDYVYVTDTGNYRVQRFGQSSVVLDDDQSHTFSGLIAGDYTLTETELPTDWSIQSATCDNLVTQAVETVDPANITLAIDDEWVCTFTNAYTPGGTIVVHKTAAQGGNTEFEFDPSWSTDNFKLVNGGYMVFGPLPAGAYSVSEVNLPLGWSLQSATCDNLATQAVETVNPTNITLADEDYWDCYFNNTYTPPPTNVCAADTFSNERTSILGIGMGSPQKHKNTAKITVPNWANLTALYGQMVAVDNGAAKYVRFIMPGKKNWTEVGAITSYSDHSAGNFWYGADIDPALMPAKSVNNGKTTINGRWFLQKSGTKGHIPRALVLYPTYADPVNNYVNVFQTFDASEGEVYWDTANGWTQHREIDVPIAPPQAATTFHVELALADNDKDARPVWITVTAGNVTQTVTPTNPDKGEQLNILTFDLPNVQPGTDEITIEVYSPSMAVDGIIGDSAALVGMTANYACAPLN